MMHDINAICDHIIARCSESGVYLDVLKLQKLLFYCQAWSLAYNRGKLFDGKFQAWIHGPVSRTIYDRFINKNMYAPITVSDISSHSCNLSQDDEQFISSVLNTYGKYSGDQLEYLTHSEEPWIQARSGLASHQRSENIISEELMENFYKLRIQQN